MTTPPVNAPGFCPFCERAIVNHTALDGSCPPYDTHKGDTMTTTDMTAKVEWHYWCPAEGTHVVAPNELHVGICVDALGECIEAHPFVVLPPFPTDEPRQAEALAIVIRDALAAASEQWAKPDGLIDWCHAHGFAFPRPTSG